MKNLEKNQKRNDFYIVEENNFKHDSWVFKASDIIFIETFKDNRICIHTRFKKIIVYGTIVKYEQKLPSYFFRAHKCYLVNIHEVECLKKMDHYIEVLFRGYSEKALISLKKRDCFIKLLNAL